MAHLKNGFRKVKASIIHLKYIEKMEKFLESQSETDRYWKELWIKNFVISKTKILFRSTLSKVSRKCK
ncbi:MAG: hypothetical protein KBG49_07440 [Spirochaetes bacterium]|nr:hypothetical protein [Spirochaetota bacterium]